MLGEVFDAEKPEHRENLESCIGPAIEQIKKLNTLPSIQRLKALKLSADELAQVRALLTTIHEEAAALAELATNPTLARRAQLYARVSAWMIEHGYSPEDVCAVCRTPLQGLIDPETGLPIVDHLTHVREKSEVVSKTIGDWAKSWTGSLSRDLPSALRGELGKDLPSAPADLLQTGLINELFDTEPFTGTLAALRSSVEVLAVNKLAMLPAFAEPVTANNRGQTTVISS